MRKRANGNTRSFEGLRDVLFDELESLRANKVKPDRANSVARLAGEITKTAIAQLEFARFSITAGKKMPLHVDFLK